MNPAGEAQALTEAAREFINAELDNVNLKCPSFQEHLTAAINCYSHAIRVCELRHQETGLWGLRPCLT